MSKDTSFFFKYFEMIIINDNIDAFERNYNYFLMASYLTKSPRVNIAFIKIQS